MSRNAVIGAVVACLLLVVAAGAILGWMYFTRDRVAVASYRVEIPPEKSFSALIEQEEELIKSDEVLKPVLGELQLLEHWKLESEDEGLAHIRSKLTVKSDSMRTRVKVIYRDRNQERALAVLEAINKNFGKVRAEAAAARRVPPVVPLDAPGP